MYLEASRYVSREEREATELAIAGEKVSVVSNSGDDRSWREIVDLTHLRFDAGYWRKANAIHKWFVDHVQDGHDDCRDYYVSRKQLEALLRTVNAVLNASKLVDGQVTTGKVPGDEPGVWEPIREDGKVIAHPTLAQELLPTAEGFFFGSTDYDQWYVEDLHLTKPILEQALEAPSEMEFYYHSSW